MLAKHRINSPSHILATIPTAVNSTHAQAPPPTSSDFSGGKKQKKKNHTQTPLPIAYLQRLFRQQKKPEVESLFPRPLVFFFFVRRKSRRKWLELGGWRHRRDLPQNRILMPQN
jgi:hypothetical protein